MTKNIKNQTYKVWELTQAAQSTELPRPIMPSTRNMSPMVQVIKPAINGDSCYIHPKVSFR